MKTFSTKQIRNLKWPQNGSQESGLWSRFFPFTAVSVGQVLGSPPAWTSLESRMRWDRGSALTPASQVGPPDTFSLARTLFSAIMELINNIQNWWTAAMRLWISGFYLFKNRKLCKHEMTPGGSEASVLARGPDASVCHSLHHPLKSTHSKVTCQMPLVIKLCHFSSYTWLKGKWDISCTHIQSKKRDEKEKWTQKAKCANKNARKSYSSPPHENVWGI